MAKIYETHKDYERDVLEDQAKDLHLKSERQNSRSWLYLAGSFVVETLNNLRTNPSRAVSWVSGALVVTGLIEWARSWHTKSKAHDTERDRERLGPAQVVFPQGADPQLPSQKDEGLQAGHYAKKLQEEVHEKTHGCDNCKSR